MSTEAKIKHTAKYRKKPVVIEAFQWFPPWHRNHKPIDAVVEADNSRPDMGNNYRWFGVVTPNGFVQIDDGEWIITGVKGEHYPCKPDIFEATYEDVTDEQPGDPARNRRLLEAGERLAAHVSSVLMQGMTPREKTRSLRAALAAYQEAAK